MACQSNDALAQIALFCAIIGMLSVTIMEDE